MNKGLRYSWFLPVVFLLSNVHATPPAVSSEEETVLLAIQELKEEQEKLSHRSHFMRAGFYQCIGLFTGLFLEVVLGLFPFMLFQRKIIPFIMRLIDKDEAMADGKENFIFIMSITGAIATLFVVNLLIWLFTYLCSGKKKKSVAKPEPIMPARQRVTPASVEPVPAQN